METLQVGAAPAYSALVIEHFLHPRNPGRLLAGANVVQARAGNRAVGAEVLLSFRYEADVVAEVRFQAYGCPHFLAAASLVTERLPGLAAAQVARWTARELWEELALPVEKRGRLLILEDAVRAAAQYPST